ncbi:MAG: CDP-diacylglycerol--glycerol-3-phosphate 3-phosphatidyltransferase [Candidatus Zixiibacteriota bacterium]
MNLPNKLTLLRILLSPVFMAFFLIDNVYSRYFATFIFLIAALTDVYDGYLARKTGVVTGFGKFMDPLADKILTATAFISFVALGYVKAWMILIIIVREFFITGLRTIAAYKGIVIMPSFMSQLKTATQMVVIVIILLYTNIATTITQMGHNSPFFHNPWVFRIFDGMVFIALALTVGTGIDYLVKSVSILKGVLK